MLDLDGPVAGTLKKLIIEGTQVRYGIDNRVLYCWVNGCRRYFFCRDPQLVRLKMDTIKLSEGIAQRLVTSNADIFNQFPDRGAQARVENVVHPAMAQGLTLGGGHL